MREPPQVSDGCRDAVAELAFRFFPSMDADDLAFVTDAILRIVEEEAQAAAVRAWDTCCLMTRESFDLAVSVHRSQTFDRVTKCHGN